MNSIDVHGSYTNAISCVLGIRMKLYHDVNLRMLSFSLLIQRGTVIEKLEENIIKDKDHLQSLLAICEGLCHLLSLNVETF